MYKLAPLADNFDMYIAILICYVPIIPLLILAYKSHKSGSMVKQHQPGTPDWQYTWVKSDKNIPFVKNAWFHFAILWFVMGSLFFWVALWPDHHDVWFIITEK
jgi:hypothetical protein